MSKTENKNLVILLHGVGASGADLLPLSRSWGQILPNTAFAAPDAPHPSNFGAGRQWFSVAGVTVENRPARIADARVSFDATLSAIIESHGFSERLERVALVGFSQGTIMALDAAVTGCWPVAAVVGFSGRLSSPPPFAPAKDTPVLLLHGEADPVIPSSESLAAAKILAGLGVAVETVLYPGLVHTISPQGAAAAGAFLVARLV